MALLDGPIAEGGENGDPVDDAVLSEDRDTSYIPLRSINAVAEHIPFIEEARTNVTAEMQAMVLTGLSTLVSHIEPCYIDPGSSIKLPFPQNRPLLSTSLQTASNLRVLPSLVQSLVLDLSEAVEERIKSAFDLSKIGKDVVLKGTHMFAFLTERVAATSLRQF